MYLSKIIIKGFRRLDQLEMRFREGLNVLVGPNNAGKTAIVDALRVSLSTGEDGALRLTVDDLHVDATGVRVVEASFEYVFRGLTPDEEADFLTALRPVKERSRSSMKPISACAAVVPTSVAGCA
ncbi:ATP-dependent nuclease [Paraburkholderia terrae]